MTDYSAIPDAVDALVALWTAAESIEPEVCDGPITSNLDVPDLIIIAGDYGVEVDGSITATSEVATFGTEPDFDDRFDIPVAVIVTSGNTGDEMVKILRDRLFVHLRAMATELRNNRTLKVPPATSGPVLSAYLLSPGSIHQQLGIGPERKATGRQAIAQTIVRVRARTR